MKKSLASVTIAASLLGGATGAAVFAPNLVSAQTGSESTQPDADATAEAPPEPGAWLADVLAGLVDDGTLTADQADAVADAIEQARPERPDGPWGRRGHGPGGFEGIEDLADVLGLEPFEIGEALRSGDSLADIAGAQGVDPQALIDAMVGRASERLDGAVADGRIDADEAAEHLAEITERITDVVNGEADFAGPPRRTARPRGARRSPLRPRSSRRPRR